MRRKATHAILAMMLAFALCAMPLVSAVAANDTGTSPPTVTPTISPTATLTTEPTPLPTQEPPPSPTPGATQEGPGTATPGIPTETPSLPPTTIPTPSPSPTPSTSPGEEPGAEQTPIPTPIPTPLPEEFSPPELIDYGPNNHGGPGTNGYVTSVLDSTASSPQAFGAQAFGARAFGAKAFLVGGTIYEGNAIRDFVHTQTLEYSLGGEWTSFEEGTEVQPNMRLRGSFRWSEAGLTDFHELDQVRVPLELPVNWQAFTSLGTMTFGDATATYGTYWFEGGNYNLGVPGHLVFQFNANVEGRRLTDGYFNFEFSLNIIRDGEGQLVEISIGHKLIEIPVEESEPGPGGGGGSYSKNSELITSATGDPVKTDRGFLVSNTLAMNLEFGQGSPIYYDVPRVKVTDLKQSFVRDSLEILRRLPGGSFEPISTDWVTYGTDTEDADGDGITTDEVMVLDFSKIGGFQGYSYHLDYNTEIYAPDGVDLSIADIHLEGTQTLAENNVWGQDGQLVIGSVVWVTENVSSNGGVQVDQNSGAIRITKVDGSGNPLYGAKFELWTGTANSATKINKLAKTTNAQGVIVFDNLPVLASGQRYWVKETVAPAGFALPKDPFILVTGFAAMKITDLEIENSPPTGDIELIKTDASDSTHFLSGAKFELYAGATAAAATKARDAKATDASGKLSFADLPDPLPGQSYWLKETVAPTGYLLPADPWTQVTGFAMGTTATVAITNEREVVGSIKLVKQGETNNPLSGAKFGLYLGTTTATAAKVTEGTTGAGGTFTFGSLKDPAAGQSYWLKELTAPAGYILPADPWTKVEGFQVDKTLTVTVSNTEALGSIEITKIGEDDNPLAGAEFELWSGTTTATATKLHGPLTTDAAGKIIFADLRALAKGASYWAKEVQAPADYVLPANPWTKIQGFQVGRVNAVSITNAEDVGSIELTKTGERGNLLPGARFQLRSGTTAETSILVQAAIATDEQGKLRFEGVKKLPAGESYWAKEIEAPAGHILPADPFTRIDDFAIGKTASITVENTEKVGAVAIIKSGEHSNLLAGAEFGLYRGTDTLTAKEVVTGITDADGKILWDSIKALSEGESYWVLETKAPAGHVLPVNPWTKVTGFELEQTLTIEITNTEDTGDIEIVKHGENSQPLSGAEFELWSGIDSETATKAHDAVATNRDGIARFEGLKNLTEGQSYWVKEVFAPAGHVLPADPWTKVEEFAAGQTVTVTIVNKEQVGAIRILKTNQYGVPLQGARFELWTGSATSAITKIREHLDTGDDGLIIITDLKRLSAGEHYWAKEISAPTGYTLPGNTFTRIDDFRLEQTASVTIVNRRYTPPPPPPGDNTPPPYIPPIYYNPPTTPSSPNVPSVPITNIVDDNIPLGVTTPSTPTVTIRDDNIPLGGRIAPKTGDPSNLLFYIGTGLAALAGLLAIFVFHLGKTTGKHYKKQH